MENVIWKDIPGFVGFYQVNNNGDIKSLKRIINRFGRDYLLRERLLKWKTISNGYKQISLSNGKEQYFLIHRLVAMAFIPNPNNLSDVNHINGIKADNRVENLEWSSRLDNMRHAKAIGLMPHPELRSNAKKVIDKSTGQIYGSISSAGKSIGVSKYLLSIWLNGHQPNRSTFMFLSKP